MSERWEEAEQIRIMTSEEGSKPLNGQLYSFPKLSSEHIQTERNEEEAENHSQLWKRVLFLLSMPGMAQDEGNIIDLVFMRYPFISVSNP